MNKLTLDQAVKKWVWEFNAIPLQLIEKAYPNFVDEVEILTTNKVCGHCESEDIVKNEDGELYCQHCNNDDDIFDKYDLPMWGTVWTFGDSLDSDWIRNNLDVVADCGIWVYESEELGIFFGIDGAGYDFYEQHWKPLYKARGLKWHSEE
ncbi:hypothetical protein MOC55_11920 [Bacillus spizizenii]|uniref:Uncharacterized protein n=1 Tax=Bacillus spizizenii TaxID=96241 RepID=A0A9Q4DND0_BACSC|nr:hypothetical protein [Bacillus spizizenii]MCY8155174.1 hypothetical protein [Bacillus spizizenii]MCY8312994.1 hypothetical protein [Bacillus spizizenii]MCY8416591.1 hypothetical protein [Bacillus spizizenii]MCY9333665.1 hypothetical protein [Bacillus spizizenii]